MEFCKRIFKSEDNEKMLGRVADIELEFINMFKEYMNCTTSVDEIIINMKEIANILTELEEIFNQNKDTIIKVWYNPMGVYEYEEIDF